MDARNDEVRLGHLETRYTHLDGRVSAIAEDMSSVKTSVDGLVTAMDRITTRLSNPTQTNWIGLGSVLLAFIFGGSQYLDLRLEPFRENGQIIENKIGILYEKALLDARESGIRQAEMADAGKEMEKAAEEQKATFKRLNELEKAASAAAVQISGLIDHTKESRRLISEKL